MVFDEQTRVKRQKVWEAVSELWLDNQLRDDDYAGIAQVLAESQYSLSELHKIYAFEVAPVVWTNLPAFYPVVAGVWAGFDQEWLIAEINRSLERQRASFVYRAYIKSRAGQWIRTSAVKEDWRRVLEVLKNKDGA